MSTVRMILSGLTNVIERKPVERRERVQCQPSAEQMEPRALLSGFKVGVATLISPPTAGGALIIRAGQAPSFPVTYQSNQDGPSDQSSDADDVKDQGNVENEDPSVTGTTDSTAVAIKPDRSGG
jgi:hypothetical protein